MRDAVVSSTTKSEAELTKGMFHHVSKSIQVDQRQKKWAECFRLVVVSLSISELPPWSDQANGVCATRHLKPI